MALLIIVGSPVFGWVPVVRFSVVVTGVLLAAVLAAAPWRWTDREWDAAAGWVPSTRALAVAAAATGLLLFWIVFSRFQAGGINGVDFTVYFDRPLYQTSQGRLYFVETTDDPVFAQLTHLAVHAYWILLPLALLYLIHATPLWLLGLSVVAVMAGASYVFRILRHLGTGVPVAAATALAFVLNDNTARTLNYGFHAEVLYAWFVPWMIHAGLRGARVEFLAAALACVLVKEDACFPLFAASVALMLIRGREMSRADRLVFLVAPTALALFNLGVYYAVFVPLLAPDGQVMYSYFWKNQGPTPWHAAQSLLAQPAVLLRGVFGSGFFSIVLSRHLFLPLLGWKWIIGLLPLVMVYGASDNDQLRMFGIYYAVPLVPFLAVASGVGALAVARRWFRAPVAEFAAAALVLSGALFVGLGYSLRPWKPETAAVRDAIRHLGPEPTILVQSGLYPHAGYEARVQLLAPYTLRDAAGSGAAILLAERVSAYPFSPDEWACLAALPPIEGAPPGLVAVRLAPDSPGCGAADRTPAQGS